MTTRWLFGDQLGPHFVDDHRGPLLMVESTGVFRRRRFHRAKAHLVLSAMRHRAAELGDRLTYVQAETYAEVVREVDGTSRSCTRRRTPHWGWSSGSAAPSCRRAASPPRGRTSSAGPTAVAASGCSWRTSTGARAWRTACCSTAASRPAASGTSTTTTAEPPPKGADDARGHRAVVAERGRHRRAGARGPRPLGARRRGRRSSAATAPRIFPATRREALAALEHFVEHRLPEFGAHEDAILEGDPWMAHSLISAPMNLGLLDPLEVVERAEAAYRSGAAPIESVEGFVRQVIGWRDYVWHVYWHHGRRLPPRERAGRPGADPAVVRRARRCGDRRALPLPHPRPGRGARLGAPHPAADGAGLVRPAARVGAGAGHRLVPPGLRRRLRLGDGAQHRRDVAARRRRPDDDEALHVGRRLHQHDERPLRVVPLRPQGAGGGGRVPVHAPATGGSSTGTARRSRATTA